MPPSRWLILLGSITMFCGGVLHTIGYTFLIPALVRNNIPADLLGAVKAVWLVFSVELALLSVAIAWVSRLPGTRSFVLFLVLIPVCDSVLMYHFVGLFIGFYVVAASAVLVAVGSWLLPRPARQSEG